MHLKKNRNIFHGMKTEHTAHIYIYIHTHTHKNKDLYAISLK